jgi:hypothetical protein
LGKVLDRINKINRIGERQGKVSRGGLKRVEEKAGTGNF